MMVHTNVCQAYVTGELVRTHNLTVGRYYYLLGLYINLIYGQSYLRTALASLIECY